MNDLMGYSSKGLTSFCVELVSQPFYEAVELVRKANLRPHFGRALVINVTD
jgi:hypothetical protein